MGDLPIIKLSNDFLKILRLDAKAAHSLDPVFAARVERLTSDGTWVSRALLLNKEGIMRLFDCGSGRITHAMDTVTVNQCHPVELDAPAARVRSYAMLDITVGAGDASQQNKEEQGRTPPAVEFQRVRLKGRCVAKLSLDERLVRAQATGSDVVWFEDDLLLRFITTPQHPLALQFVSALKHFCSLRDPPSSFSLLRSSAPLEEICGAQYKQAYASRHGAGGGGGGGVPTSSLALEGRRKPNRLANTLNVFKKEISTIQALAKHTRSEILASGGEIVVPVESPRTIGVQENESEHGHPSEEGEAAVRTSPTSGDRTSSRNLMEDGDENLTHVLLRPTLSTIPISLQRSQWIPQMIWRVQSNLARALDAQRAANKELYSRLMILTNYADIMDTYRDDRLHVDEQRLGWLRDFLDEVVTPYTDAKLQVMHDALEALKYPLPEFDRKAFDEEMLAVMYERDSLEEEQDKLHGDTQRCQREMDVELREDPEELRQADESAAVLHRLRTRQDALRASKQALSSRIDAAKLHRQEACMATLAAQDIELERLAAHLKRLKSIYALHEELTRDVPPTQHVPHGSSMGSSGRRIRMMHDT